MLRPLELGGLAEHPQELSELLIQFRRFVSGLKQDRQAILGSLERFIGVIYRPETELHSHYAKSVLPGQFGIGVFSLMHLQYVQDASSLYGLGGMVAVPDVVGQQIDAARTALQAAGLTISLIRDGMTIAPDGFVATCFPEELAAALPPAFLVRTAEDAARLARRIRSPNSALVLAAAGRYLAGAAVVDLLSEQAQLSLLVVHPHYRRIGVGRQRHRGLAVGLQAEDRGAEVDLRAGLLRARRFHRRAIP